jgi:hypothetical protein
LETIRQGDSEKRRKKAEKSLGCAALIWDCVE